MFCAYPGCDRGARSHLPLMNGKVVKGELSVCHEPEHIVWGGGECAVFGDMSEDEQVEYLERMEIEEKETPPEKPVKPKKKKEKNWSGIYARMRSTKIDF